RWGSFPAGTLIGLRWTSLHPRTRDGPSARAQDALAALADHVTAVDHRGVAPGAADHEVAAPVARLDPVVPGAAVEPVGAPAAPDQVVARVAVEPPRLRA